MKLCSPRLITALMISIFLFACLFQACATAPKTPLGQYSAALEIFDDAIEGYLVHYNLADLETQTNWKQDIDPNILVAGRALKVWGLAVKRNEPAADKYAQYMALKRDLFSLMFTLGILEVR